MDDQDPSKGFTEKQKQDKEKEQNKYIKESLSHPLLEKSQSNAFGLVAFPGFSSMQKFYIGKVLKIQTYFFLQIDIQLKLL